MAYSKVTGCETSEEEQEDEVATPTPASNHPWKHQAFLILVVSLASFGAGIVVTQTWFPTVQYVHGGKPPSSAASCRCNDSAKKQDSSSVSYRFMETPKGKDLQKTLRTIWTRHGATAALTYMAQLMQRDSQVFSSCHPVLHRLGRTMAWTNQSLQEALEPFLNASDGRGGLMGTCNAACMHGLLETKLKTTSNNITQAASGIQDDICDRLTDEQESHQLGAWECQHGIGHGILQRERVRLQQFALEHALQVCRQASVPTSNCRNGVWMEYWVYQGMTLDMDFEQGPDPLQVCYDFRATMARGVKAALETYPCIAYAPTAYLLRHPRQYTNAVRVFCRSGNEDCINGVGMQAAKENMFDLSPAEEACLAASKQETAASCFDAAVGYHKMFASNSSAAIPVSLCDDLTTFKAACLNYTK